MKENHEFIKVSAWLKENAIHCLLWQERLPEWTIPFHD
jgi:hypothetical protein